MVNYAKSMKISRLVTTCNSGISFNRGTEVRRTHLDVEIRWFTTCKKGYSTEVLWQCAKKFQHELLYFRITVKLTGSRKTRCALNIEFSEVKLP